MLQNLLKRAILATTAMACLLAVAAQELNWESLKGVEGYVDGALERGWMENERAWRSYRDNLLEAARATPWDPQVYWMLGELHQLHAVELKLWPSKQRAEWEVAKRYYLEAATRSPGDGVLLARVSSRLALTNDRRAVPLMQRALALAPYEPVAQYNIAEVGMRFWSELDPDLRESFKSMLRRALKKPEIASGIRTIAKRNRWTDVLATL